jgi:MFS family permease
LLPTTSGHGITRSRGALITLSLGILVFLQSANISLLTTTQGVIAGDLDAFESTAWFTSAYLVAASSLAPIYGKLSYIFPASFCLFMSSIIMTVGAAITAYSPTLPVFLLGRVVTGVVSISEGQVPYYSIWIFLCSEIFVYDYGHARKRS